MSREGTGAFLADESLPDRAMRVHTTHPLDSGRSGDLEDRAQQVQGHSFEKLFTPAELADLWSLSLDTVRRLFEREPGILMLSLSRPGRRRYRTLRIPLTVADRVYRRLTTR
jgi:hypothetical protein